MVIGARSGAATGPIPAEARRQEGLRLERPGASPLSRFQALPVHSRQRCPAQQRQQQLEGGIKAALQLLQRAGADLSDR